MSLANDLRDQAGHLILLEKGKPKQASLRRGISTSYYALFELLGADAVHLLVAARPSDARRLARRQITHAVMRKACEGFSDPSGKRLPSGVAIGTGSPLPPRLCAVAATLVTLQALRHRADYDTTTQFNRAEAWNAWLDVANAFADWQSVRRGMPARLLLTCILFPDGARR
jgi:hypothetical protein